MPAYWELPIYTARGTATMGASTDTVKYPLYAQAMSAREIKTSRSWFLEPLWYLWYYFWDGIVDYPSPLITSPTSGTGDSAKILLAPWDYGMGELSDEDADKIWGLPVRALQNLSTYFRAGLPIKGSVPDGPIRFADDIAPAGTRPVETNTVKYTIDPSAVKDTLGLIGSGRVTIEIYITRHSTKPYLTVVRKSWPEDGESTDITQSFSIPDVPYFVFNFGVVAPGGPTGNLPAFLHTAQNNEQGYYLKPSGGSGAGALFTAVFRTYEVAYVSPGSPDIVISHRDKITITYIPAVTGNKNNFKSSSFSDFVPGDCPDGKPGIDLVEVHADLHYQTSSGKTYWYSKNLLLPGGLMVYNETITGGIDAPILKYKSYAQETIRAYINNGIASATTVDYSDIEWVESREHAEIGSALDIHYTSRYLPPTQNSYSAITLYTTFLNPEGRFYDEPRTNANASIQIELDSTKVNTYYASGMPSLFSDGPSPKQQGNATTGPYYFAVQNKEGYGAGASGCAWPTIGAPDMSTSAANGGPAMVFLSW